MKNGTFTISLDFELFWGVLENKNLEEYKDNLEGTWKVIPKILDVFKKYDIHATWGIVGFLFFHNINELENNFPEIVPKYRRKNLSTYEFILNNKKIIQDNFKYFFAPELIDIIRTTPNQEIASHTFSHFYIFENNSLISSFIYDCKYFNDISVKSNIDIRSIILPKNYVNQEAINILKKMNFLIFRGNPNHWAYINGDKNKNLLIRIFRFFDTYINLSGYRTSLPKYIEGIYEVKSSMFLRPYTNRYKFFEKLKILRIKRAMLYAAKNNLNFHLWWHPHNFGINIEKNIQNLISIMKYYSFLNKKYGLQSKNMSELISRKVR